MIFLKKHLKKVILFFAGILLFISGWISSLYFNAGEQAMGTLLELVSTMKYLEDGNEKNALSMLQRSAEENILIISKYGTPIFDWYVPKAREKWFRRYADIRYSHQPIEYPDNGELRKEIDQILLEAGTSE